MATQPETTMTMKKLIAIIATAVVGLIAAPQEAEAGHASVSFTYQSGRSSCGCPIYTKRHFHGYDCYRRPIYRYVHVPVTHRCRSHAVSPHHYRHGRFYYKSSRHHRPVPHYRSHHGPRPGYGHGSSRGCR